MSDSAAGAGSWLNMEIPIEKELTLESHRRAAAHLHHHELVAVHDSLMVSYCHLGHILDQAMRRIAELEARDALCNDVQDHHLQWARDLLANNPQP